MASETETGWAKLVEEQGTGDLHGEAVPSMSVGIDLWHYSNLDLDLLTHLIHPFFETSSEVEITNFMRKKKFIEIILAISFKQNILLHF